MGYMQKSLWIRRIFYHIIVIIIPGYIPGVHLKKYRDFHVYISDKKI